MSTIPRLVISAPSSGHGKTAVTVGLLSALSARGYRATGFKIGPDHVDAAYLGLAAGRPGRNLDPRMVGAKRIGPLLRPRRRLAGHRRGRGHDGPVRRARRPHRQRVDRADLRAAARAGGAGRRRGAMGQSVAALVHGFRAYDELLWLGGVILNRVASRRHEQLLREALDDIGVPVLGALRRHALTDIAAAGVPLPSRHHGVAPVVHHNLDAVRAVRRLGEVVAGAVDIDRMIALARSRAQAHRRSVRAPRRRSPPRGPPRRRWPARPPPVIAVASPIRRPPSCSPPPAPRSSPSTRCATTVLPDGVDALLVGGALPEWYADELGFNSRLRAAVSVHAAAGQPIVAEGTGLVWLCRDFDGRPMCGVVDASARGTTSSVGYRQATARSSSVLLPVGAQVVGYKLHRTTITPRAGLQAAWTWAGGPAEGFVHRGVHASYLGLHWAGAPSIASRFVAATGAAVSPAQGQWTTPSTHPYGRPSVVPAAQAPSGSGSTLQFPAAATTTGPAANLTKTPAAVTRPVGGDPAAPVSAPGGFAAPGTGLAVSGSSPVSAPAAFSAPSTGPAVPGSSPVSAPGTVSASATFPAPATFSSPATFPAPGTGPAASPVSVPGPVSAPGGFAAAPPATYSPPAPWLARAP